MSSGLMTKASRYLRARCTASAAATVAWFMTWCSYLAKMANKSALRPAETPRQPTALERAMRREMRPGPETRRYIGYVESPPACKSCTSYHQPNNDPEWRPYCKRFIIQVAKNGVCDYWEDRETPPD